MERDADPRPSPRSSPPQGIPISSSSSSSSSQHSKPRSSPMPPSSLGALAGPSMHMGGSTTTTATMARPIPISRSGTRTPTRAQGNHTFSQSLPPDAVPKFGSMKVDPEELSGMDKIDLGPSETPLPAKTNPMARSLPAHNRELHSLRIEAKKLEPLTDDDPLSEYTDQPSASLSASRTRAESASGLSASLSAAFGSLKLKSKLSELGSEDLGASLPPPAVPAARRPAGPRGGALRGMQSPPRATKDRGQEDEDDDDLQFDMA